MNCLAPSSKLSQREVLGVHAAHGFGKVGNVDLAGEQARQQQVAGAAEVLDLKDQHLHLLDCWLNDC
jgi:hypothetical protein